MYPFGQLAAHTPSNISSVANIQRIYFDAYLNLRLEPISGTNAIGITHISFFLSKGLVHDETSPANILSHSYVMAHEDEI